MRASLWIVGCGLAVMSTGACNKAVSTTGTGGTTSATSGTTAKASSSTGSKMSGVTTSGTGTPAATGSTGATGAGGGPPAVNCNPVTAKECNLAAGETCDLDTSMAYVCFPSPNIATLCTKCDTAAGPFCGPGLTCVATDAMKNAQCVHYCCTDTDCGGAAGSCTMGLHPMIGLCAAPDATKMFATPVCTGVPATSPSMGSCFTTPPGG